MALQRHFDYTPDQADINVRFELRNQGSRDDGEPSVALTVVDLESDGDDDGNLTIQLAPPDIEGLIDALEQTLDELVPVEEDVDEEGAQEEEQAEEPEAEEQAEELEAEEQAEEPKAKRPARRTRGSKRQQEDGEE